MNEKVKRSFDYQCKRASECRHEKYQISCNSCPELKTCEIQEKIETAREVLYGHRYREEDPMIQEAIEDMEQINKAFPGEEL